MEAETGLDKDVVRVVIVFNIKNNQVSVSGHIDNVDLCMKMCIEGAHLIMERGAKMAMDAHKNGSTSSENPPAPAS
jgi:hypothetical protein